MSRNDPFGEPTNTGLPGNRGTTEQGTARVETRLTGSQGTGQQAGTGAAAADRAGELVDRASDRVRQAADQASDRASELGNKAEQKAREWGNEAQEQLGDLKDRASGYVSRARGELDNMIERAEDQLEEQTGAISMVRSNPLLAAGLAFGVGFLLAGDGGKKRKRGRSGGGVMGRATGSIRSAVVGGVSTMLMQELQEMMDEHGGPMGLLNTITGRGSEQSQRTQPQRATPPAQPARGY
jgi:ElaB/YqjD/DUF883 family membrane-anchored ribosome-binding protein